MLYYTKSFKNNYIWILTKNKKCIIVNPGEYKKPLELIKKKI